MHPVQLRAPAFLGGGPVPAVIRRTDQRFIEGLLRDLQTEHGRAQIKAQVVPRAGEPDALLYLPVHRCFNLVLAEAYCEVPGQPRLDPESLDGTGVVVRRRRPVREGRKITNKLQPAERWVSEHGRVIGWLATPEDATVSLALEEDPESARRPQLRSGRAEVDSALATRRALATVTDPGPFEETYTELFPAPPEVCAALGSTLLFGLIDVADPMVPERARPRPAKPGTGLATITSQPAANPGHTSSEVAAMLPLWLRHRSPVPPVPSEVRGQRFRAVDTGSGHKHKLVVQKWNGASWADFTFPEPWRAAPGGTSTDLAHFLRMLWQVRVELQTFSGQLGAAALLTTLSGILVARPSGGNMTLAQLLEAASNVFVMLEENTEVEFPNSWPEIPELSASQVVENARASLTHQLSRLTLSSGRFDDDSSRYELRVFARVRHDDGCPSELVWSKPTPPMRVAKWFDGGPDDVVLPTIELPPLDRGFMKKLRPNVSIRVPRSMFNFLNNNSPDKLLKGEAENDTSGPAIAWICGFNISIIFTIAFMLLITFVLMLNIAFWWMAFFRICIPLPVGSGGED